MSNPINNCTVPKLYDIACSYVIQNTQKIQNLDTSDKNKSMYCLDDIFDHLIISWNHLHDNLNCRDSLKATINNIQESIIIEELFLEKLFVKECKLNGSYQKLIDKYNLDTCCKSAILIEQSLIEELKQDEKSSSFVENLELNQIHIEASIKKAFIEKCQSDGSYEAFNKKHKFDETYKAVVPQNVKEELLQKNVHRLFQKLAAAFNLTPIPTNFDSYNSICKWEDEALEIMWSHPTKGFCKNFNLQYLQLNTASKIKAWIMDPTNATLIARISRIDFSNCKLKYIPPEILKLPELNNLDLTDNQITTIPEGLEKSNINNLSIKNNQITTIPEGLEKSKLQNLYLNNNQITTIPEGLEKSKLQSLDLTNNKITTIPVGLANSNLIHLWLTDNPITVIPKEFLNSTKLKYYPNPHNPLYFYRGR
jgi:Leucine-rich repeat (LRR) protein